jgi:hypothetical protein
MVGLIEVAYSPTHPYSDLPFPSDIALRARGTHWGPARRATVPDGRGAPMSADTFNARGLGATPHYSLFPNT